MSHNFPRGRSPNSTAETFQSRNSNSRPGGVLNGYEDCHKSLLVVACTLKSALKSLKASVPTLVPMYNSTKAVINQLEDLQNNFVDSHQMLAQNNSIALKRDLLDAIRDQKDQKQQILQQANQQMAQLQQAIYKKEQIIANQAGQLGELQKQLFKARITPVKDPQMESRLFEIQAKTAEKEKHIKKAQSQIADLEAIIRDKDIEKERLQQKLKKMEQLSKPSRNNFENSIVDGMGYSRERQSVTDNPATAGFLQNVYLNHPSLSPIKSTDAFSNTQQSGQFAMMREDDQSQGQIPYFAVRNDKDPKTQGNNQAGNKLHNMLSSVSHPIKGNNYANSTEPDNGDLLLNSYSPIQTLTNYKKQFQKLLKQNKDLKDQIQHLKKKPDRKIEHEDEDYSFVNEPHIQFKNLVPSVQTNNPSSLLLNQKSKGIIPKKESNSSKEIPEEIQRLKKQLQAKKQQVIDQNDKIADLDLINKDLKKKIRSLENAVKNAQTSTLPQDTGSRVREYSQSRLRDGSPTRQNVTSNLRDIPSNMKDPNISKMRDLPPSCLREPGQSRLREGGQSRLRDEQQSTSRVRRIDGPEGTNLGLYSSRNLPRSTSGRRISYAPDQVTWATNQDGQDYENRQQTDLMRMIYVQAVGIECLLSTVNAANAQRDSTLLDKL